LNLSETNLDAARLSQMATQVGIDAPTFNSCYESEKYKNLVDVHADDAWMAGANGTPYTLVVGPNGEVKAVHGAVSFETLEEEILKLL
jgi:predicted DsbA family dithiol-disulfide isomerase